MKSARTSCSSRVVSLDTHSPVTDAELAAASGLLDPSLGCAEHQVAALRKSVLQDVDVNSGVVEQLSGLTAGALDELEV